MTAASQKGHTLWAALTLPGTGWMVVFFLVPFYAVAAVAFGRIDPILASAAPRVEPAAVGLRAFWNTLDEVFTGSLGRCTCARACTSGSPLAMCVVIGYPVAYYVARHARPAKKLLLLP